MICPGCCAPARYCAACGREARRGVVRAEGGRSVRVDCLACLAWRAFCQQCGACFGSDPRRPCRECHGAKMVDDQVCPRCEGQGYDPVDEGGTIPT